MTTAHASRLNTPLRLPLSVGELFAGVGGFHLGLDKVKSDGKPGFSVIWGNQWEPSTNKQHAFEIYRQRFPETLHSNQDISKVSFESGVDPKGASKDAAPDVDVLVGGFPCQDYSVARTLNQAAGIMGKKGVLWWQIHRFLTEKSDKKPAILILENVDRLLKSPANQRGRDFAVLLQSLSHFGYIVEWRVINAAEYGFPQRRRRVFIVAYHESLLSEAELRVFNPMHRITSAGVLAKAFPVSGDQVADINTFGHSDLVQISSRFNKENKIKTPFKKAGIFRKGNYWTMDVDPVCSEKPSLLRDVLEPEATVPDEFFIPKSELPKWVYLKGGKSEERTNKATGFKYFYAEGPIAFPDKLDRPSRTIITGEGGRGPSRFKHVVKVDGRYRRLMPIELERLNGFPDNHTAGPSDGRRAFFMGNALVVGVVTRIGQAVLETFVTPRSSSVQPAGNQVSSIRVGS